MKLGELALGAPFVTLCHKALIRNVMFFQGDSKATLGYIVLGMCTLVVRW